MFTPIHLLPQNDSAKAKSLEERWDTKEGQQVRDTVLALIRNGAGKGFLDERFQNGSLRILENEGDLRGLSVSNEDITFLKGEDNLWAIDFSYASFSSKFKNATFSCSFWFSRIVNCEFVNCTFYFNEF